MPNSGHNGEWLATTPEFWARVRQPIVAFQIWYADGSRFVGLPRDWSMAPDSGVQVLVVYHPIGSPTERVIVVAKDAYTLPGQPGEKLGLMIDHDIYERIRLASYADPWRP